MSKKEPVPNEHVHERTGSKRTKEDKMILKIISLIIILIGVIFIYDARMITTNWLNLGEQNNVISGVKILGFILAIIGGIILL